jgi:hypothetical protein
MVSKQTPFSPKIGENCDRNNIPYSTTLSKTLQNARDCRCLGHRNTKQIHGENSVDFMAS